MIDPEIEEIEQNIINKIIINENTKQFFRKIKEQRYISGKYLEGIENKEWLLILESELIVQTGMYCIIEHLIEPMENMIEGGKDKVDEEERSKTQEPINTEELKRK